MLKTIRYEVDLNSEPGNKIKLFLDSVAAARNALNTILLEQHVSDFIMHSAGYVVGPLKMVQFYSTNKIIGAHWVSCMYKGELYYKLDARKVEGKSLQKRLDALPKITKEDLFNCIGLSYAGGSNLHIVHEGFHIYLELQAPAPHNLPADFREISADVFKDVVR